jgi:uncharacterized protein YfaS (alpha-2-macroglobulin family)
VKSLFENIKNALLSWEFLFLNIIFLGLVAIMLETPTGSLAGSIALEVPKTNLFSYDLKGNRVYALVNGPRNGPHVERGAWVNNDGTFQIDQLPVGEYTLEVRAPGFGREFARGLFVEDGKVAKMPKPLKLSLLSPSVNIASNSRVFTTKDKPNFWVNATGAAEATVKVYRGELKKLLDVKYAQSIGVTVSSDLSMYLDSAQKFKDPFSNPVQEFTRKLNQDSSDSSHAEFAFDKPLPPGDYFTVCQVKDLFGKEGATAMTWFSVSDIGLVIKQSPDEAVIRAVDLVTLKSAPNVELALYRKDNLNEAQAKGKTGADGIARIAMSDDLKAVSSQDLMILGKLGDSNAYGGYNYWRSDSDTRKTYFFTDRPVYRLGQTVMFKGICRKVAADGLINAGAGEDLVMTVEDPDNNSIQSINLKTNKYGAFSGLINIPENGKTGGYQVQIAYGGENTSYHSFEVAQYRKPEYQVEVEPISERLLMGEKGRARVRATYYFGGPVAGARVKYSIYSSTDYSARWKLMDRPEYYGFFDGFEGDDYDSSSGDYLTEGYAVTDANGEAIVEFDTTAPTMPLSGPIGSTFQDRKLKIEAEVTDISRLSVVSSGYVPMSAADFTLFVDPSSYVVKSGESLPVSIKAVDYQGKAIGNKAVNIKIMRFPYDSIKQEYKPDQVVVQQTVTTDGAGKASLNAFIGDQLPSDSYYVVAEALDDKQRKAVDTNSIWIAQGEKPFFFAENEAKVQPLTVKLDKKVYKPGDKARVILSGPFTGKEGFEALVSVEGTKIHELKVVPLTSSAQLVELDIKDKYAPNCFVSVAVVGKKRQFYTLEETVLVSPDSHFMKLAVKCDKEKYKPGDDAVYTIEARDQAGKPVVGAELAMAVVDESIYAIRGEAAEDICKFFYSRINNWVTTLCSFPEQYSGGPDKMEPRVRKDFKDTAAWFPSLITDSQGKAVVKFKMPDNLTTWRATVRGITLGTDVGSTVSKVIATQDIIARLALPRFFSQGDQGLVTAVVHNYTSKNQDVKLNLELSGNGLSTNVPLAQTISIAPDAAKRFSWAVTASAVGQAKIKLTAIGQTAADALEKTVSVRPMGVPVSLVRAGLMTRDDLERQVEFAQAADAVPGTISRNLSLSGSTIGPVLGNFKALIDYPYGCTEQTMSRLVPSTIALQLSKQLDMPLSSSEKQLFDKVYKEAMAKLTSYQHSDGGWGWWQNDESRPYLTSYVMEGMKLLADSGYSVDREAMKRASQWTDERSKLLLKALKDPKRLKEIPSEKENQTDLAYMLYSQSLWGFKASSQQEVLTYLRSTEVLPQLTPEALAYLARAANNFGLAERDTATAAINRLVEIANNTDATVDWEYTKKLADKLGDREQLWYSYRFSPEETTALALAAIVEVKPNSEIIEKTKNWLLITRGKEGWGSTKATAQVFKALLIEEIAARKMDAKASLSDTLSQGFSCLVDGIAYSDSNRYGKETLVSFDKLGNQGGKTIIANKGGGRLYYFAETRYFKNLNGQTSTGVENLPSDLKMERHFYRIKAMPPAADGTVRLKTEAIADGQIKAGETVLMKTIVNTPRELPYIMVEACLPSGAEVVQDSSKEGNIESEVQNNAPLGDWGEPWWTHQDVLDDRIVYFGASLKPGQSEFATLLRMELPGKVGVPPVSMEGMYTKAVRGLSNLDVLKIAE